MELNNQASSRYQGDEGKDYFAYQNLYSNIGGKLDARKFTPYIGSNDRVLDFGCGGGWILKEINCKKRIGIEVNEHAHISCVNNGIQVYKKAADVIESDFDVITSHHCLEHVPHPVQELRLMHGLLKSDGVLLIVVPIDDWRIQRDYTGTDINHHLHTWTSRLMANTLAEAGFKASEIRVLSHAWFPGWHRMYGKIPDLVFDTFCYLWSILMKRRQLFVCAKKVEA